jgi:hypothetical protein
MAKVKLELIAFVKKQIGNGPARRYARTRMR